MVLLLLLLLLLLRLFIAVVTVVLRLLAGLKEEEADADVVKYNRDRNDGTVVDFIVFDGYGRGRIIGEHRVKALVKK